MLLDLVTDAQVGDWLLVHAGVAIAKWDEPPPDKVGGSEPSEKPTTEGA
jgi:hydrogenase maturation factor